MSLNTEFEIAMKDDVGTFRFEEKEYICEITRYDKNSHWCGYLLINSNHPWYERNYDNINANCHGGLTYSEYDKQDKDKWKIGFDCAHFSDFVPKYNLHGIWRDREYVESECKDLVKQAIEAKINHMDGIVV